MKSGLKCGVFVLVVTAAIVAVGFRLPQLQQRPMHGDEAIHAVKFAKLLEQGSYTYDPHDYHGPTLNYLTLIPAWLSSASRLSEIDEFTVRIVPVFFGVLLVLLLLLLADGLGPIVVIFAAILTAISPAFVFYSRYYIQEMLLVCFTFAAIVCGYRYTKKRNAIWALLTGAFLGLCCATKETCIIVFASMVLAFVLVLWIRHRRGNLVANTLKGIRLWHLCAAVVAAGAVSAVFYSSFFTNPTGISDSFRAYIAYVNKASQNQLHQHPWYYYLKMLIFSRYAGGPVWSEAIIVILAGVGFVVAMARKGLAAVDFGLLRFIAFYTIIMTVLYSVIGYKTPWCLLGFFHGMILLAAVGAVALLKLAPNVLAKTFICLLLIAGGSHLAWQAYLASYVHYAEPTNPYVYAHTSKDVFAIAERIENISQIHPDGRDMAIQVICPAGDYWPLPWYLRAFGNIGWSSEVDENMTVTPVVIASPAFETAVLAKLYELPPPGEKNLYVPLFDSYTQLRPGVEIRGYTTKDLWDSYLRHNQRGKK